VDSAEHAPAGPLDSIIGLEIKANGQRLDWKRDPYEMYAISLTVPAGATQLDITLDTGMPADGGGFSSSPAAPRDWHHPLERVCLSPQGP